MSCIRGILEIKIKKSQNINDISFITNILDISDNKEKKL